MLEVDVLRALKLINDFNECKVKLVFKLERFYRKWPPKVRYVESELKRKHKRFNHWHTDKQVNLMHRGAENHSTFDSHEDLKNVRATYETCRRLSKESGQSRVALPHEDGGFDRVVGLEIIKICDNSSLHFVDLDT